MMATTATAAQTTNRIRKFGSVSGRDTEEKEAEEDEEGEEEEESGGRRKILSMWLVWAMDSVVGSKLPLF